MSGLRDMSVGTAGTYRDLRLLGQGARGPQGPTLEAGAGTWARAEVLGPVSIRAHWGNANVQGFKCRRDTVCPLTVRCAGKGTVKKWGLASTDF